MKWNRQQPHPKREDMVLASGYLHPGSRDPADLAVELETALDALYEQHPDHWVHTIEVRAPRERRKRSEGGVPKFGGLRHDIRVTMVRMPDHLLEGRDD